MFKCKMCMGCCHGPRCVVIQKDIDKLKGKVEKQLGVKKPEDLFYLSQIINKVKIYRPKLKTLKLDSKRYKSKKIIDIDGQCIFLDIPAKSCIIYKHRPEYGKIFNCKNAAIRLHRHLRKIIKK